MEELDILLIEDSMSDAEMMIRAFNKNNISQKVVHVEDGAAALEFLFGETVPKKPKVIVLDLNMPKINGLEVLKKIRENSVTKCIPVVVLSSSKEYSDIKQCYDLRVNSYIVKPVEFREFSETVTNLGKYWLKLNLPYHAV